MITDSYPPHHFGGYELRCKEIVDGLRERGHDLFVLTTKCPGRECKIHPDDQKIYRKLNKPSGSSFMTRIAKDFEDIKNINKEINKMNPQIIYLFHLVNLSNAIMPFLLERGKNIVYDEGGTGLLHAKKIHILGLYLYNNPENSFVVKNLKKIANYLIYQISNKLLVTNWEWSQNIYAYFNSKNGLQYAQKRNLSLNNATVLYSAVDTSVFMYQRRYGFDNKIRIITPGRIDASKGTQAAVALVKKLIDNDIQVEIKIIGMIEDKVYYQRIEAFIKKHDLGKYIMFFPMLDHHELADHYREADICFFPSRRTYGLSRVPLEAMACGSIVITYGNEGSDELIIDGRTGFIVTPEDGDEVVKIIKRLTSEPEEVKQITNAARSIIEAEHTMNNYIKKIENYLLSCIKGQEETLVVRKEK